MSKMIQRSLVALSLLAASSTGALAVTCADRAHVISQLEAKFGETLIATSMSRSNNVLGVYASEDARTWSIIITLADRDLACLAATGKGSESLQAALPMS